ncbi:hypothetical protein Bhyg_09695 [Pseudolycoriella hygida]|uniref:Uncharacterized protein n=1 Tax=Pseudolycoriella hygida TaxID=35572 RepID=A0A9Q0MTR8_9DIPT|nr:hypothetical protein Bhyg_09695 [Pseudolycoriella hygida]
MQADLVLINKWLKGNLLVLNTGKTKFMIPCRSTRMAMTIRNFGIKLNIDGEDIEQLNDYLIMFVYKVINGLTRNDYALTLVGIRLSFVPWMPSSLLGRHLVYADDSMDSGINKRVKDVESETSVD